MTGQLDIFELLKPEQVPVDFSKLVGFTMSVSDPDELDRIALAWSTAYHDKPWQEWRMFPGWRESHTGSNGLNGPHPSFTYTADLRSCGHERYRTVSEREANPCLCLSGFLYRIYCSGCDWWTGVADDENGVAEAYLDHCWNGWRELPVIESTMKPNGGYTYHFPRDYPEAWKAPGSPLKECRGETKYGTRHVPSGSPYGGYRAAAVRPCEKHSRG